MERLTNEERDALVIALATREGTAKEISLWYGMTVTELRAFADANWRELQAARNSYLAQTPDYPEPADAEESTDDDEEEDESTRDQVTPTQLDELWITSKFDRLLRYQIIADQLYKKVKEGGSVGSEYATELRELRSYMLAAANELGQLLHRGAGDAASGDTLGIEITGIDLETLK